MAKVSILLPVYNVEDYLEQCLDSIVNQTFKDIEIICVNDGSTDNSLSILESYAKMDERIKIFSQDNKGLGYTRTEGIKYCNGDYVYSPDSDDFLDLDLIEKLYNNAISNDSDFVIFKFFMITDETDTATIGRYDIDKLFPGADFNNLTVTHSDLKNFVFNGSFMYWTKFYKKDFLERYEDFVLPSKIAHQDVIFHFKIMLRASRISILPEYLYHYRRNNVKSVSNTPSNHIDIIPIIDQVEEFLINEGFMEVYKELYNSFKITQITYHLQDPITEEYFKKAKEYVSNLHSYQRDVIEDHLFKRYELVLKSSSLDEYLQYRDYGMIINPTNDDNDEQDENDVKKDSIVVGDDLAGSEVVDDSVENEITGQSNKDKFFFKLKNLFKR